MPDTVIGNVDICLNKVHSDIAKEEGSVFVVRCC